MRSCKEFRRCLGRTVTITPNVGYSTITPVGGSCGGLLSGNNYTTSAVVSGCTVIASFLQIPLAPTPASSPVASDATLCAGPATFGGTATCTATATPGYRLVGVSGCGGVTSTTSPTPPERSPQPARLLAYLN